MSDIGVLTEKATKVAPYRGNGIRETAWTKVVKGFFFDGIHMLRDDFIINQRLQPAGLILPNAAYTPPACFYHATMAA